MKKLLAIVLCLCHQFTHAQNGALPPTHFDGHTDLCNLPSWKLVLEDHFNGDSLSAPWLTFNSWLGMPGGDHEDWEEARCVSPYNAIYRKENVEVSNGTVKLKVRREPATWRCATCRMTTRSTDYTNATIATPYTLPINSGKFEARIRMPVFRLAHCAFWTWHGTSVNEIDIAEAYGVGKNGGLLGDFPRINYSLHSWEPGRDSTTNPFHLPHTEIGNRYPNQSWWDKLSNTDFDQSQFHVYGCEWTPSVITISVDGAIVNTFRKYYQKRTRKSWPGRTYTYTVGSGCIPDAGEWLVLPGFPWNEESQSNLRFTAGLDGPHGSHPDGLLGEMEIDWVKVWQPDAVKGWSGASPQSSGGQDAFRSAVIGQPQNSKVVIVRTVNSADQTCYYSLAAVRGAAPRAATFEWDVWYGPGGSQQYHASGQTIASPPVSYHPGAAETMTWRLTIRDSSGTRTRTGAMTFLMLRPIAGEQSDTDANNLYAGANITDRKAYEAAVDSRLMQSPIAAEASEAEIVEHIGRIELEELEPYLMGERYD